MATKYTSEFTSTRGAQYRVQIDDSTYGGTSPVEITMAPPGFTLEYDGSTSDRYTWVIGSTASLHYIASNGNHDQLLNDIAGSAEGRYRVTIEQHDGAAYQKKWCGVILPEQIETDDIAYPTPFTLKASDDLANLREVEYNAGAGTPYTGSDTVAGHLAKCLSKLRTFDLLEAPVIRVEEAWQSNQASGTGYDRVKIRHAAFYEETDGAYELEYKSTYDVLTEIASTFGLRIFHANGQYIAQSISQAADAPTVVNYSDVASNGAVTQTSTTRPNISTTDQGLERQRGWRNSYLNPLKQVTRDQPVGGSLFFAGTPYYTGTSTGSGDGTGILDGTVEPAPIALDDYVSEGSPLALSFKIALIRKAVAFTGNEQVLPYRVRVQLRAGNQYLSRPVTFAGTYSTVLVGGGTVEVAAYTYGQPEWTTNSASRVEFVTPPQQMTVDWTSVTTFGIAAPGLPAGYSGQTLSWSFTADAIDSSGNVYPNAVNAYNYATGNVQQVGAVRIYNAQTYLVEGNTATYQATNNATNGGRETLNLPASKLGDNIGPETVRYVFALDANDDPQLTEDWARIGTTEALEINALLCREVLAGQTKTIRVQRGSIINTNPDAPEFAYTLEHVLTHNGTKYLPFSLSVNAYADAFEGEWFEILTNSGDITVPTEAEWTGDVDDPLDQQHAFEAIAAATSTQGEIVADHDTKLGYITVTQSVNLDTIESDTAANKSNVSSLQYQVTNIAAVLKTSKTDGGAGVYADGGKATTASHLSVTDNTATLQAGQNTGISISENSPGTIGVNVQAGASGSETSVEAFTVYGDSGGAAATVQFSARVLGLDYNYLNNIPDVVNSINGITGAATISAGPNITITRTGNDLEISSNQSGGSGSDSFNTIAVSGQSDVVAESGNDTLTLIAGTNVVLTTDAGADSITFATSATPSFTTITASGLASVGSVFATDGLTTLGAVTAYGALVANATLTVQSSSTFTGKATYTNGLITGGLEFIGNGTSVIAPVTGLPNLPDDLEIRSNGNVVIALDYDNNEPAQSFKIQAGDGTTILEINENGVTTGLLTTTAPTLSGLNATYQQGSTISGTVANFKTGTTYIAAIYDSAGDEVTSNPVTIDGAGNITATAPSAVATGYELRVRAAETGKFQSPDATHTLEVTPSRTFTHWRLQAVDVNGTPSNLRLFITDYRIYDGPNATGNAYPPLSPAATSNTSLTGVTISAGYTNSSSYEPWKAFDGNYTTSGWWSISVPNASQNWIQVEFDTAVTAQSIRIREWQNFNYCPYVQVLGSNTGAYAGEEVLCGTFTTLSDSTYGSTTVIHTINV